MLPCSLVSTGGSVNEGLVGSELEVLLWKELSVLTEGSGVRQPLVRERTSSNRTIKNFLTGRL